MQLKYDKQIKNKIITIELETASFTKAELSAMERIGEPTIKFEKMYAGKFPVAIEKKVRTGFKVRVRFDGTEDILAATASAEEFFMDITTVLEDDMRTLMDSATSLATEFQNQSGFLDIRY